MEFRTYRPPSRGFRHAELCDPKEGSVNQEDLLVGSELGLIEDPYQHDRHAKRDDKAQATPCHQDESWLKR